MKVINAAALIRDQNPFEEKVYGRGRHHSAHNKLLVQRRHQGKNLDHMEVLPPK